MWQTYLAQSNLPGNGLGVSFVNWLRPGLVLVTVTVMCRVEGPGSSAIHGVFPRTVFSPRLSWVADGNRFPGPCLAAPEWPFAQTRYLERVTY
jgi:hypothetical protein